MDSRVSRSADPCAADHGWRTRNLTVLSGVSFLQDAASELLYPILPIFLTVTLGPPVAVGGTLYTGTSLAQVTQAEINATMKGRHVPGKPLLVVKADDGEKTVERIEK
mgnify:CR=1 FL=1